MICVSYCAMGRFDLSWRIFMSLLKFLRCINSSNMCSTRLTSVTTVSVSWRRRRERSSVWIEKLTL